MSAGSNPGIVAPSVRDLEKFSLQTAAWLAARLPSATDFRVSNLNYPLGAGMSHETILMDAAWRENGAERIQGLVVRIKPTQHTVYLDDMFDAQYRVMQLMHDSGKVRVAKPLWFEEDPALFGAPFFVMEKVAGRVAVSYPPYSQQGWLVETAPADRRRMWEDSVTQLAAIQLVPISDAPFLALPGAPPGFDYEADRWRRYIDWVDAAGAETVLRDSFEQLLALKPGPGPEGIVWGDSRLGNMMIGPDFTVAAVMDWEQPSLGGALHDLGWWLYSDHVQTIGRGITPLEGMGTRDETIALWREVSGKPADGIEWYEAFACFKMECLAIRMMAIREMPLNQRPGVPGANTARYIEKLKA